MSPRTLLFHILTKSGKSLSNRDPMPNHYEADMRHSLPQVWSKNLQVLKLNLDVDYYGRRHVRAQFCVRRSKVWNFFRHRQDTLSFYPSHQYLGFFIFLGNGMAHLLGPLSTSTASSSASYFFPALPSFKNVTTVNHESQEQLKGVHVFPIRYRSENSGVRRLDHLTAGSVNLMSE